MEQYFFDAFPTLFLPKDLPTKPLAEETDGLRNERDSVLQCWQDFLSQGDLKTSVLLDLASVFVDLHLGGASEQPSCVIASLEKTKIGGYWGYHVRAQNAAVLIYRHNPEEALYMAWQVQNGNHDVTNNVSIHQTYPQRTVRVAWKNLVGNTESLCDLAKREQPLAIPASVKSGERFDETRDVNNPFFVLDVMASMFGGEVLLQEKFLDKKMRDEVRYQSSELPWRREPVYSVLKSILHLVCLREFASEVDYKVLVQRFLMYCLDKVGEGGGEEVSLHEGNSDYASMDQPLLDGMNNCVIQSKSRVVSYSSLEEASRKIVRRQEKLREVSLVAPPLIMALNDELEVILQKSLRGVNRDWEERCKAKVSAKFDVPLETMKGALEHTLPNSGSILTGLSNIGGDVSAGVCDSEDVGRPEEFERLRQWSPFKVADIKKQTSLLGAALTTRYASSPQDLIGTMGDISEGILHGFENVEDGDDPDAVTVALLSLEMTLIEVGLALGKYQETSPFHDVRSRSEVILVAFTICLLIDKIACKEYSLLTSHQLGIHTSGSGIFDHLFLPRLKYRAHLAKVEEYLLQREHATGPPTLEDGRSEKSFAVKFAKMSRPMEKAREEIMNVCRDLQVKKRSEKVKKQNEYDSLMRKVTGTQCSCHYRKYYGRVTCDRCHNMAKANDIVIACHEKYLPTALHLQQAVVFELQIPDALACQRSCFILFARSVCEEEWQEESDFRAYWIEDPNLSRWKQDRPSADPMKLGSTTKKVSQSHYRGGPVCSRQDFVVENGYGVKAMGSIGPMIDIRSWTWSLSLHTTMRVSPGRYHSLQKFFNSYSHTEKEVIALKSEADEELSLKEFEEVGCLRAGPSLQLSRLLRGLQQKAFSLDREEIVSLFCCVLWQIGPCSLPCFFRKSCSILWRQRDFSMKMCQMLDDIITSCRMNWSNNNALLSVVHISRHLLEHSIASENDVSVECVKILRSCRLVAIDWIENLLTKLSACTDDDARQSYRQKTVDISAMGALTYLDHEDLLNNAGDVNQWSFLRAVFHDNYVPNEMMESSWRRPHLLHCMQVAEQVAPRVHAMLGTEGGQIGLSIFLSHYWSASERGDLLTPWKRYSGISNYWFFAHFELAGVRKIIQFDVIGGAFLVDGSPCARLPKAICAHQIYRRLFDNALFLVQPLGRNAFRTSRPVNGFHFEFYSSIFNKSLGFGDNPIIVKERAGSQNPERSVLLPDSILDGDFPKTLTSDYSHWFILCSEQDEHLHSLYFRPLKYTDPRMSLPVEKDDFVLRQSEKLLVEQMSGACFLDIHSPQFKQLYDVVFCRLSPAQFVHCTICASAAHEVTIELPRLNHLSFEYNGKSIRTRQLGGLEVADNQNCGVFIGLKHGLLLEDPDGLCNKVFLCPQGSVSRSGNEISIDTKSVMNPPFFKYTLRSELWDLKLIGQGRLAWLFLALLHARTGDLKPDPFTGCTGTKRALDILRLGFSQGNLVTSTDDDTLRDSLVPEIKLLGRIAKVSVHRENYHDMEKVTIGSSPPLCAHDGFALIAAQRIESLKEALRLIGKSHLLKTEYKQIKKECFDGRMGSLTEKSYFQRRKYYPMDSCLTKEEEATLSENQSSAPLGADPSRLGLDGRNAIQEVGFAAQSPKTISFEQSCLQMLLDNKKEVVGCSDDANLIGNVVLLFDNLRKERVLVDDSIDSDDQVEFHNIWLHLYRMAQCKCGTGQGQILFGSLLTFVAAHYPSMLGYLHQLILVMKSPHLFPSPPQHQTYRLTNEVDFVQHHVDNLIDLDTFSNTEPVCPSYPTTSQEQAYEKKMKMWEFEKDQHARVNRKTRSDLQSLILNVFCRGSYVNQADVSLPHVLNRSQLVRKLKDLFDRWRQSRELKLFREKIATQLKELAKPPLFPISHALNRFETRPWEKESFELTSQHSLTDVPIEPDFQQLLENMSISGQCEDSYEKDILAYSSNVKKEKASPFSFLPADVQPSEAALCKKLANELQASVAGALSSPEQSYEFFEDSGLVVEMYQDLVAYKQTAENRMSKIWNLVEHAKESSSLLLPLVGLWNSNTPWNVLSHHFNPSNISDLKSELATAGFSVSHLINAFVVSVKNVQRARRCLSMLRRGKSAYPTLAHDISSQGCAGWTPKEYPEFLAFEVDNDICVRHQQCLVAKEILRNDLGNRVLQMNMGCGKSSVIMPLVLCTAADGISISRGTVLTSLYTTNAGDWQSKVGGLLARQIFPLVCCRDMDLGVKQVLELSERLTLIRDGRHLLVTVPEHRLSLENKAIEACVKEDFKRGKLLLGVIHKLAAIARDFVDESDEIASPKYQLVYPLGSPQDMDGAQIRWLLHGAVLQSVSRHAERLFDKYGAETVEMLKMKPNNYQYSAIRLLDGPRLKEAYNDLCSWVLDDITKDEVPWKNGLKLRMKEHEFTIWKKCVMGEVMRQEDLTASLKSDKVLHSALCLRGILSHGILLLVLQKRVRVEYGSHPVRNNYQMAVPYRFKDVAAERTDFAHPDVCLGLTFATYYQSGLSEEQLLDVFKRLSCMSDAAAHYSSWTEGMSGIGNLETYSAINLEDQMLFKDEIYPAFCNHIGVIDFWLHKVIFPAQAKQYQKKITSTAVDLFKSKMLTSSCDAITTGFSGTDDLSLVLPPTVKQLNLEALSATNGVQILNILRNENNTYYALNAKEAAEEHSTDMILSYLREAEVSTNVVLDAGALVLHMNNEQFSRSWLKQRKDCDACVFFKKDRIVFVSSRDDTRVLPFSGSQFEADMSNCLLYLDDEHTRGSDFKLPLNARALVTLGKGMNKDKFVQACMRMRQIGKGQQLTFVASHDVNLELERFEDDVKSMSRVYQILLIGF